MRKWPDKGITRFIYIDRLALDDPDGLPIQILEGEIKNPTACRAVTINGPSRLVFNSLRPLWSSARVWVETEAELTTEP